VVTPTPLCIEIELHDENKTADQKALVVVLPREVPCHTRSA
jgi:hypothetical protein